MRVAFNNTAFQLLRGSKVILIGVGELPCFQVLDGKLYGKYFVCSDLATIWGVYKFAGWHIVDAGNIPHRDWVARTGLNLLSIGDSLI